MTQDLCRQERPSRHKICVARNGRFGLSSGMSHLLTRRLEDLTVSRTPTQARLKSRSWDVACINPAPVRDAGGTPLYAYNDSGLPTDAPQHSRHCDDSRSYEQSPGVRTFIMNEGLGQNLVAFCQRNSKHEPHSPGPVTLAACTQATLVLAVRLQRNSCDNVCNSVHPPYRLS